MIIFYKKTSNEVIEKFTVISLEGYVRIFAAIAILLAVIFKKPEYATIELFGLIKKLFNL